MSLPFCMLHSVSFRGHWAMASISKQSAWDSVNQKLRQFAEAQVNKLLNGLTSAELKAFAFFPLTHLGHLYYNIHYVPRVIDFAGVVDLREITNGQPCPFGLQHLGNFRQRTRRRVRLTACLRSAPKSPFGTVTGFINFACCGNF
jgi:hypothetical protein